MRIDARDRPDPPANSAIGFIQRELDRIRTAIALREAPNPECDTRLRAASQALSWALEPSGFATPYDTIMGIPQVQVPVDCSESPHLAQS